jgi:hypothetical protein
MCAAGAAAGPYEQLVIGRWQTGPYGVSDSGMRAVEKQLAAGMPLGGRIN